MPIRDIQKKDKPGLSRAGVIRLGYKLRKCKKCNVNYRANGNCPKCGSDKNFKKYKKGEEYYPVEFPTQSDHFVLTDAPGVAEILGNEPKQLRIWFPFNDIDFVFPAWHQLWVSGGLVCRGDGEKIEYAINPQNGKPIVRDGRAIDDFEATDGKFNRGQFMSCPGNDHTTYTKCQNCKPNAMLIVMLRDVPRLAYYQIATASIHNIVELTEQLTYIQDNVGKLQGVPFILKLELREISAPSGEGGKRQRTKKYLLGLEVDPEYYERLVAMQNQLAAPERKVLEISAGDIVDEVAEVIEPLTSAPQVETMEPPEWSAPNGNDDSEFVTEDWDKFCDRVLDSIKYFQNVEQLAVVMDKELNLTYDVENETFIFDALAVYAKENADKSIAEQEAEMITGQVPMAELPQEQTLDEVFSGDK